MNIIPEITEEQNLIFGHAPNIISCGHDIILGNGRVIPEINFTLPPMEITKDTWKRVKEMYADMTRSVCMRSIDLYNMLLIVEFELLPPMTHNPQWGAEITGIIREILDDFHEKYGLCSAIRATPVDIRDNERPPRLRSGHFLETILKSFELCAKSGANLLSIESTGGKELHDLALVSADLAGIILSLGVLASRDMEFLWDQITEVCNKTDTIPAGDSACGFANTAMVLADRGMIPKTLAAIVRTASVPRSLAAYLHGAKGPSKDCAYEGPYMKALMGVPISMEGRSSACAHLSPIGNIAACAADLWSNESVQNVRLLSGPAPVVSMEQLIYDCRIMNITLSEGKESALRLRNWLAQSDAPLDPQAFVLLPEVVIRICKRIANISSSLDMTFHAVDETLSILRSAVNHKMVHIPEKEAHWIDLLSSQLQFVPHDASELWSMVKNTYVDLKIDPGQYLI